ncbi:hypothetical protein ZWY2020_054856 [Hordeum vulgare]|nr:hypothetical protein ZWY2020_054856 [Hordeum vulgare]
MYLSAFSTVSHSGSPRPGRTARPSWPSTGTRIASKREMGGPAHGQEHPPVGPWEAGRGVDTDAEMSQLFISYRGYCARKGMHLNEVILDGSDISKAIIDYATGHAITDIVVGASSRNTFIRRFRNPDVPTCLMKMAPDYCTVHVIHKGKVVQVKAAKAPAPFSTPPPKQNSQPNIEPDALRMSKTSRTSVDGYLATKVPTRDRHLLSGRQAPQKDFDDYIDFIAPPSMELNSVDYAESLELSSYASLESLKAEMRRLRLELKQTMEMYNSACKEALGAKQKYGCLVCEYMDYGSLEDPAMQKRQHQANPMEHPLQNCCRHRYGLLFLHSEARPLVRDLKPGNILLDHNRQQDQRRWPHEAGA